MVRGVVHMHARKIIHLDLKSANILLTRDGTAKIADVSLPQPIRLKGAALHCSSCYHCHILMERERGGQM